MVSNPKSVILIEESAVATGMIEESAVATGNSQLLRQGGPRRDRDQHRPNNTDGRNMRYPQLQILEERLKELESIRAVYDHAANASGYLLEIRKLAAARRPELYGNQIQEYLDGAIVQHAKIQQLCGTIANDIKRDRKDLVVARKRLRTQEILTDWNESEVYRLRRQVDAILNITTGQPWWAYKKATDAHHEEMDYSDAASSTSSRPNDNGEEGGNSSGGPPQVEVVGRTFSE